MYSLSKDVTNPFIDRIQRLKDARAEATKEIDSLKARKNEEFIDYEKKVCLNS